MINYFLSKEGDNTLLTIQQIDNRPGFNSKDEGNDITEEDEQSVLWILK